MAGLQDLQAQLSKMQNPAGLRAALLSKLGIQQGSLQGMASPDFDQKMMDLYKSGVESQADFNTQEGDIASQYEKNRAQSLVDQRRALKAVGENFAARGLSFSGMNEAAQSDTQEAFAKEIEGWGGQRENQLAKLDAARASLAHRLASTQSGYERNYGQDVQDWIVKQAAAAQAEAPAAGGTSAPSGGGGGGTTPAPEGPSAQDYANLQSFIEQQNVARWVAETQKQQLLAAQRAQQDANSAYWSRRARVTANLGPSGYIPGYVGPQ